MNVFTTSDLTLLILLTLMGVLSLVLLVKLALAWFYLPQQYHKGEPPSHNRDDADYKRGV